MSETSVPKHIGLILDGNRRWARAKGLPTFEGHRKGYDNLKDIARSAFDYGVEFVSAYIFSTENWKRTEKEVKYLMGLAERLISKDLDELHQDNIRLIWLGSTERVSNKLQKLIQAAEEKTKENTGGTLCLCFNYGGHQELVDATRKIVNQKIDAQDIDTDTITEAIYGGKQVPAVDLMIRTSGEYRLSGFMLWRVAYSELIFTDTKWPDFSKEDLHECLEEYSSRQRRYGK